jgi:hypothetical protein
VTHTTHCSLIYDDEEGEGMMKGRVGREREGREKGRLMTDGDF